MGDYDYQSKFTGVEIDAILDGAQKQKDWLQTDDTQVDFIKNKPFGDELPITEYFSQAETPNPVSFGGSDIGYVCYKISDTILTSEQVAKGVSIATNGVVEDLLSGEMQSFDGFVMVKLPSGQTYALMPRAGELILNSENGFSVNIPESGIYIMFDYGTSLPEGLNVEFSYIGTKKIDPKYLPKMSCGINIFDYELTENKIGEDGLFHLSEYESSKLENLIFSVEPLILRAMISSTDDLGELTTVTMDLQHSCGGYFYAFFAGLLGYAAYNHDDKTLKFKFDLGTSTTSTTTTYSLRQSTEPTFAEVIEMITQSMRDRGLIK